MMTKRKGSSGEIKKEHVPCTTASVLWLFSLLSVKEKSKHKKIKRSLQPEKISAPEFEELLLQLSKIFQNDIFPRLSIPIVGKMSSAPYCIGS